MSRKTRTHALTCAALALVIPGPALAETLTLPAAVNAALAKNPETRQAEARSRAAEAARDQISRSWFPQVALEGAAGYRHLESTRRIALGLANPDEYPLFGGVDVNQHLLDFGRRGADLASRRALVDASYQNALSVGQVTMLGAAQAWLDLMLYSRSAATAAENLDFHQKLSQDMREGVAKGALSISEQQQADERLQNARAQLLDAQQQLGQARARFAALTGITPDEGLNADTLPPPAPPAALLPATLPEFITVVNADNPRLREARFSLRSAEADVRRVRADYLPTLDVNGSARTGKDYDGYLGKTNDYQALATLRVPLFDGGVTAARVREAVARADAARYAVQGAERDGELQARVFWQRRETMRARATVEEERARVATDVLGSYKSQFTIGRRSLLDVLDAQAALFNARLDAEAARSAVIVAELSLLAAADRIDDYLGIGQAAPGSATYGPR